MPAGREATAAGQPSRRLEEVAAELARSERPAPRVPPTAARGRRRAARRAGEEDAGARTRRFPLSKPRALKPGDTVALISPSSYIFDLWELDAVAPRLASLGLKCKFGRNVRARRGLPRRARRRSGSRISTRCSRIPRSRRSSAWAAATARERLLDPIDYGLDPQESEDPPRLLRHHGTPPRHREARGPGDLPRARRDLHAAGVDARLSSQKALFSTEPIGDLDNPPETDPLAPAFPRHTVSPGARAGAIARRQPDARSRRRWERPTRSTRRERSSSSRTRARRPTASTGCSCSSSSPESSPMRAGIVWGTCTDCDAVAAPSFEINLSMSDLLDELLGDLGKPVLAGLVFGHTKEKVTLPIGVEASSTRRTGPSRSSSPRRLPPIRKGAEYPRRLHAIPFPDRRSLQLRDFAGKAPRRRLGRKEKGGVAPALRPSSELSGSSLEIHPSRELQRPRERRTRRWRCRTWTMGVWPSPQTKFVTKRFPVFAQLKHSTIAVSPTGPTPEGLRQPEVELLRSSAAGTGCGRSGRRRSSGGR